MFGSGCGLVLWWMRFAPLLPFPSPQVQLFCIMTHAPHWHALCCCEHLRFLSLSLSPLTCTHTHTHCDTKPTSACVALLLLLLLLLLLVVVLLSLWCAQPSLQQHWCRRSSGDCRGAEEQQHAAEAGVSAVCVDLGGGCDCACGDGVDESVCVRVCGSGEKKKGKEGEKRGKTCLDCVCGSVLWWMHGCALYPCFLFPPPLQSVTVLFCCIV